MSAVLNTNIASLWASKNLLGAQNKLAASVERLSSGLRINRARDDAAGLGVANSLTAQINGANQGIRNLNDAISMVQTAEGAIAAASEMGQRILMLATQGANGTLGLNERKAIATEMKELLDSINSIGGRTQFSGNPLLSVDINAQSATLYSMQISNSSSDEVLLNNSAFFNIGYGSAASTESSTFTLTSNFTVGQAITVGGRTVTATAATATMADVATALRTGTDSGNATVSGTLAGWTASGSGNSVTFTSTTGSSNVTDISVASAGNPGYSQVTTQGATTTNAQASNLKAKVDTAYSLIKDRLDALAVDSTDVPTSAELTAISEAYKDIQDFASTYVVDLGTQRSKLGAYQNQMEYTLSNITELSSNLQSARSRVIDTDYASETASLTKGQILQQAATAMLAQANQMPNVILTLLK